MNVFENDVVEFDDRRWLFPVAGSGFVVSEVKFNLWLFCTCCLSVFHSQELGVRQELPAVFERLS